MNLRKHSGEIKFLIFLFLILFAPPTVVFLYLKQRGTENSNICTNKPRPTLGFQNKPDPVVQNYTALASRNQTDLALQNQTDSEFRNFTLKQNLSTFPNTTAPELLLKIYSDKKTETVFQEMQTFWLNLTQKFYEFNSDLDAHSGTLRNAKKKLDLFEGFFTRMANESRRTEKLLHSIPSGVGKYFQLKYPSSFTLEITQSTAHSLNTSLFDQMPKSLRTFKKQNNGTSRFEEIQSIFENDTNAILLSLERMGFAMDLPCEKPSRRTSLLGISEDDKKSYLQKLSSDFPFYKAESESIIRSMENLFESVKAFVRNTVPYFQFNSEREGTKLVSFAEVRSSLSDKTKTLARENFFSTLENETRLNLNNTSSRPLEGSELVTRPSHPENLPECSGLEEIVLRYSAYVVYDTEFYAYLYRNNILDEDGNPTPVLLRLSQAAATGTTKLIYDLNKMIQILFYFSKNTGRNQENALYYLIETSSAFKDDVTLFSRIFRSISKENYEEFLLWKGRIKRLRRFGDKWKRILDSFLRMF